MTAPEASGRAAASAAAASAAPPPWRRWLGRGLLGTALLAVLTAPWWGPRALATLAFFHVRRVEFEGVRYTTPEALMAALAIDTMVSVFDPLEPLVERVRAHEMVLDARARRELPGTVIIAVRERTPVALVAGARGMVAVDVAGEVLPIDPARVPVDAPVVSRIDTTLLALLDRVREGAPALWARVASARPDADGSVRLDLGTVTLRARGDVTVARLGDILPVEADLARRRLRAVELDVRFRDQVIARLP